MISSVSYARTPLTSPRRCGRCSVWTPRWPIWTPPGSAMEYGMRSAQAAVAATLRTMGLDQQGPVEPPQDARFADPAWTTNPLFYLLRQQHALLEGFLQDLLEGAELDEVTRRKADFALRQ